MIAKEELFGMISGNYSHTLDSKNRITLPAKLRDQIGEDLVLTRGVDKCISLYPRAKWDAFTEKLDALPATELRRVKRFLFSSAFETTLDSQGRMLVPPDLCEYASLAKNVRVVGVGDHLEIWDESNWIAETEEEDVESVTATLVAMGL